MKSSEFVFGVRPARQKGKKPSFRIRPACVSEADANRLFTISQDLADPDFYTTNPVSIRDLRILGRHLLELADELSK